MFIVAVGIYIDLQPEIVILPVIFKGRFMNVQLRSKKGERLRIASKFFFFLPFFFLEKL
jgi:hypothetical protein